MIPIQAFTEEARRRRFEEAIRNAAMCMSDEDVRALADGFAGAQYDNIVSTFALLTGRAEGRLLNMLRPLLKDAQFWTYAPVILAHFVRSYAKYGALSSEDVTNALKQLGLKVDDTDPVWKEIGPSTNLESISKIIKSETFKTIARTFLEKGLPLLMGIGGGPIGFGEGEVVGHAAEGMLLGP